MTGSDGEAPSWIQAWIEQQREQLRRAGMTGNQSADNAASDAEAASGQIRNLGLRWLEMGQSYLQGWQQLVQQSVTGTPGVAPLKFGEEMISAMQGAWAGTASAGEGAARQFAYLAARWPALGLAREHTEAWRELMAAQAECQQLEQDLRNVWAKVQADALTMVERLAHERNAARQPAEQSTANYRELYDLWVECGEKVSRKWRMAKRTANFKRRPATRRCACARDTRQSSTRAETIRPADPLRIEHRA